MSASKGDKKATTTSAKVVKKVEGKKAEGGKAETKKADGKKADAKKSDGKKAAAKEVKKDPAAERKAAKEAEEKKRKEDEKKERDDAEALLKAKFDAVDWSDRESIVEIFPSHIKCALIRAAGKPITKAVNIEFFNLKQPMSDQYLLKDAPLTLEAGKKACLVGDAGCGKSTLFAEIARGSIKDFPPHLLVHHCQEIELSDYAMSVIDTVVKAHDFRNILLECERRLKEKVGAETDDEKKAAFKENLDYIQLSLQRINSDTAYDRAGKMLRVLGFDEEAQKKSTNALSGGLRMRVALCAAFFVEADILLLDEPTNHLDFPSVLWLENRLRAYRGSFIIVCHDRDLLKNVCTSVISIEEKTLVYHASGFGEFERKRDIAHKKKAEEIDKFMNRHRNIDFSSPLALEKKIKKEWLDRWTARQVLLAGKFTFPDATPLTGEVVESKETKTKAPELLPDGTPAPPPAPEISLINLKDTTFSYNTDTGIWIFKDPINFHVTTATRMGVMGPNGAGKSTLLKLITDKLKPNTGEIYRHPTATVAYFAQHTVQDLDLEQTAIEYMISQFPKVEKAGLLRQHLAKVGIEGTVAETRMKSLSAGLKSCVVFARITYICPHLLIMDEPTNFLDLESIDALIHASNKFKGALLLVSHNRSFLLKCANKFLSVVPGKFEIFDDLKTCERATYQFIEQMEAGVKIGAQNLVKDNPSADAAAAARTKAPVEEKKAPTEGLSIGAAKPAAKAPVAAAAATTKKAATAEELKLEGQACSAIWAADGKRYPSKVLKALGNGEIKVSYNGYDETGIVKIKDVVFPPPKAAAAKPAGKPTGPRR